MRLSDKLAIVGETCQTSSTFNNSCLETIANHRKCLSTLWNKELKMWLKFKTLLISSCIGSVFRDILNATFYTVYVKKVGNSRTLKEVW